MLQMLNKRAILVLLMVIAVDVLCAQSVDFANLKKTFNKRNAFRIAGGLNASFINYDGNNPISRDPNNWYLSGNVNVQLFGQVNLPFSLNLTNAGNQFQTPTSPNRIGVHPTYKWITAHIGDVAMNFSPYTLQGHQFTGGGVDLSPKGNFKISAMYGRLQKAVTLDTTDVNRLPAYKRMGYGAKVLYTSNNKKATLGMTVFGASDRQQSLSLKPDSVQVYPQQNLVTSFNVALRPSKGLEFTAEYAMSALTKDIRDTSEVLTKYQHVLSNFIDARNSTSYYKAIKTQFNYHIKTTTIGFGYERIDPGYKTLGTYFFANDLENVTIHFAKSFFSNKAAVSANFGIQQDDLDDAKSGKNTRYIIATNVNYNPNAKVAANFSYSNFQTFMNIKPIFQLINQVNQFQNLDTLNFTQVTQNANLNLNVNVGSTDKLMQNINTNFSYQDAVDRQNGQLKDGGSTQFYNGSTAYSIYWVPVSTSFSAAFNINYNTIANNNFTTLGPTFAINSKLFKKKMTTGIVVSLNKSTADIGTVPVSSVHNVRFNLGFALAKKHHLLMTLMNQVRSVEGKSAMRSTIGNIGYSFSFQ